jgi:hypothetical protein
MERVKFPRELQGLCAIIPGSRASLRLKVAKLIPFQKQRIQHSDRCVMNTRGLSVGWTGIREIGEHVKQV